jgi:pentatricopeptide repeat protein
MPLGGFIAPLDPMWLSTLDAMDRELISDSLVYRYNPAASPDGLHGEEGTFSLCTFLYVDALARAGRLDDAVLTFNKMHTYGNHPAIVLLVLNGLRDKIIFLAAGGCPAALPPRRPRLLRSEACRSRQGHSPGGCVALEVAKSAAPRQPAE